MLGYLDVMYASEGASTATMAGARLSKIEEFMGIGCIRHGLGALSAIL